MDYWRKFPEPDKKISDFLEWGVPEQKTGSITVVGGNSQNFATEIKATEFLNSLPLRSAQLVLPDALRSKIPPVPGVNFSVSTESGSFAKSPVLNDYFAGSDFVVLSGDLSKNSATAIAISDAIKYVSPSVADKTKTDTPLLITRDSVDLLCEASNDFIERDNLIYVASMAQLQKLFRALLYPKMIMLSQPIMPIIETLHKFTLSYTGLTLLTFHANPGTNPAPGQIIIAHNGNVWSIPIDHTSYTPLSLWSGTLACKVAAFNLWSPSDPLLATASAVFWNHR